MNNRREKNISIEDMFDKKIIIKYLGETKEVSINELWIDTRLNEGVFIGDFKNFERILLVELKCVSIDYLKGVSLEGFKKRLERSLILRRVPMGKLKVFSVDHLIIVSTQAFQTASLRRLYE